MNMIIILDIKQLNMPNVILANSEKNYPYLGNFSHFSLFKNLNSTYNLSATDWTTFFNKYCSSVIFSTFGNSFLENTFLIDTSKLAQNLLYALLSSKYFIVNEINFPMSLML